MKTKLFTVVLCSLMLLGLGCSSENEPNMSDKGKEQPVSLKEEEPNVPEEEEPNVPGEEGYNNLYKETIVGKWKLVRISTVYDFDSENPEIVDYSKDNIIYDFHTSNKLIVSGYVSDDLSEGEHSYRYQKLNVGPLSFPGPNLTIDNDSTLFCTSRADDDKMIISGEKITGRVVDKTGLIVKQGKIIAWSKSLVKSN
jgi:hypothetical protein